MYMYRLFFILGIVLGLDEWHLPICYQNPPFTWENACTKSWMCCFSVVPWIENSDGWASYRFCLFLWTFPFECALEYGTIVITFIRYCANRSGVMSYRCSFRDIQGSKRPNTINLLFQILSLNIPSGKESEDLPYLYWIPKLHKTPYKERYIAGS